MIKRKLIEVALPLEAINRESERDTPKRSNHPWRLHFWWARRKLATARAVLFAQLVDDPSSHPEQFPTFDAQRAERERLHGIVERLVAWENARDENLLKEARAEIFRSSSGAPPAILDPFAGGGSIPLEAQRLGLEAHASDLNPVAVLINKALIELPPRFRNQAPVHPGAASERLGAWPGASGLASDVRSYGTWIRSQAIGRVGSLYPTASGMQPLAWSWARTVQCPNPACRIDAPLMKSWWLAKKVGRKVLVAPEIVTDTTRQSGLRVGFVVTENPASVPANADDGTVGRRGGSCIACGAAISLAYIRDEGRAKRMGQELVATIVDGGRRRSYVAATQDQIQAAKMAVPDAPIAGSLGYYPRDLKAPTYGLTEFADLFTPRQLTVIATLSDLVIEARQRIVADGGTREYADAIVTYLGLALSRGTDYQSNVTTWHYQNEQIRNVFARQAIPMAWDFLEVNILAAGSGTWASQVELAAQALDGLVVGPGAHVAQAPAQSVSSKGLVLSTDPPYYDNVEYAELADFFYVWLRRTLRHIYPDLFSTLLVPKSDELVANQYRHDGNDGAKRFFEDGFRRVFADARAHADMDYPITVYYAFKQSESNDDGDASSGWETLLEGMIRSGWMITSTWPFRTETVSRMLAQGKNALASSIVLSLRPRPEGAPTTDRRGFIAALEAELPDALRKLQQGAIAPVDLPQAAIGPGMAVFSRYSGVLEPDGSKMTVRSALVRINEILDQVLNEQEGDYRPDTRFAITWYRLHGYAAGKSGEAENVATARAVVLGDLARSGILTHRGGVVQLLGPSDLDGHYDPSTDQHISTWEVLHHLIKILERDGVAQAGDFLRTALDRLAGDIDADELKELAHLLFRIAESNGWTKDALSFNTLVTSWPEIIEVARSTPAGAGSTQGAFSFDEEG